MSKLGRSIDKLNLNLLGHPVAGSWEDWLTENDWSLLGSENLTSDEEVVVVDDTVVWEATHWGNVLLNCISFSCGVVGHTSNCTSTKTIDLLVDLSTRVVTLLTSTSNRPLDGSWMPSSDTSNLTETSVSLSSEFLGTESLNNTLGSLTLGDTDGINTFVGFKNFTDWNFLFKLAPGPVNFLGNSATVHLDLHDLRLVLSLLDLADLSGSKNANNGTVLLDAG